MKQEYYILGEDGWRIFGPHRSLKAARHWLRTHCRLVFTNSRPIKIMQVAQVVRQCPMIKVVVGLRIEKKRGAV